MNATSTADSIGTLAGTVIETALDVAVTFMGNNTLLTALIVGGIALFFLSKVRRWM